MTDVDLLKLCDQQTEESNDFHHIFFEGIHIIKKLSSRSHGPHRGRSVDTEICHLISIRPPCPEIRTCKHGQRQPSQGISAA